MEATVYVQYTEQISAAVLLCGMNTYICIYELVAVLVARQKIKAASVLRSVSKLHTKCRIDLIFCTLYSMRTQQQRKTCTG